GRARSPARVPRRHGRRRPDLTRQGVVPLADPERLRRHPRGPAGRGASQADPDRPSGYDRTDTLRLSPPASGMGGGGQGVSAALTEPKVASQIEMYLVIPRLKWEQYEAVTAAFGDRPALKTVFVDGRLTLLSPSRRHDWHEKALGRLVEAVANGLGIEWETAGHATYRREEVAVGGDGDE